MTAAGCLTAALGVALQDGSTRWLVDRGTALPAHGRRILLDGDLVGVTVAARWRGRTRSVLRRSWPARRARRTGSWWSVPDFHDTLAVTEDGVEILTRTDR